MYTYSYIYIYVYLYLKYIHIYINIYIYISLSLRCNLCKSLCYAHIYIYLHVYLYLYIYLSSRPLVTDLCITLIYTYMNYTYVHLYPYTTSIYIYVYHCSFITHHAHLCVTVCICAYPSLIYLCLWCVKVAPVRWWHVPSVFGDDTCVETESSSRTDRVRWGICVHVCVCACVCVCVRVLFGNRQNALAGPASGVTTVHVHTIFPAWCSGGSMCPYTLTTRARS